jgi:hypothetical protein
VRPVTTQRGGLRGAVEQQVSRAGEDLGPGAVAVVGGEELRADRHAEGEQAAGLDLVGGRGEDWIRLEAASWFLGAEMLVQAAAGRVSWTTCLRHDRRVGRIVWPPLSAVHRRLVPRVLRDAAGTIRAAR